LIINDGEKLVCTICFYYSIKWQRWCYFSSNCQRSNFLSYQNITINYKVNQKLINYKQIERAKAKTIIIHYEYSHQYNNKHQYQNEYEFLLLVVVLVLIVVLLLILLLLLVIHIIHCILF